MLFLLNAKIKNKKILAILLLYLIFNNKKTQFFYINFF